jgi:hypothetical protein
VRSTKGAGNFLFFFSLLMLPVTQNGDRPHEVRSVSIASFDEIGLKIFSSYYYYYYYSTTKEIER